MISDFNRRVGSSRYFDKVNVQDSFFKKTVLG
ncbi:hypothetical protein [Acinetobacter phage Ab69]|nr:hypothetical protein [Acinetobacter phage Ab69]